MNINLDYRLANYSTTIGHAVRLAVVIINSNIDVESLKLVQIRRNPEHRRPHGGMAVVAACSKSVHDGAASTASWTMTTIILTLYFNSVVVTVHVALHRIANLQFRRRCRLKRTDVIVEAT